MSTTLHGAIQAAPAVPGEAWSGGAKAGPEMEMRRAALNLRKPLLAEPACRSAQPIERSIAVRGSARGKGKGRGENLACFRLHHRVERVET